MRRKPSRKPPDVFRWFFGYHAFDLHRARELVTVKPVVFLTTVNIAPLLEDGVVNLDSARTADTSGIAILARVPMGEGFDRYILIDGYETAHKCHRLGRPLRLKLLSKAEAKACRIESESSGEWPN